MLALLKTIARKQSIFKFEILKSSNVRNLYSSAYFGIKTFEEYSARLEKEKKNTLGLIKSNIQQAITNTEAKILTDDLKTLLYLSKEDSDLDLLLKGIRKYQSQESMSPYSFHFETPLSKLLYKLNKTDIAIEVFTKNEYNLNSNLHRPRKILMNKLVEEKRFDDFFKIAQLEVDDLKKKSEKGDLLITGVEFSNLVGNAALLAGTRDIFQQTKHIFKTLVDLKANVGDRSIVSLFLLAINQNDYDYAYGLSTNSLENARSIKRNLKIIALSKLNRTEDALNEAKTLSREFGTRISKIFPSTIEALTEAVNKANNVDLKKSLDDIRIKFKTERRETLTDLKDYALKLYEQRERDFEKDGNNNQRSFKVNINKENNIESFQKYNSQNKAGSDNNKNSYRRNFPKKETDNLNNLEENNDFRRKQTKAE